MLKALLGNSLKERILLAVLTGQDVYARELASLWGSHLLSIQNQFKILERGGILESRLRGRTRLYAFNPRYPFLDELKKLLNRTLDFVPPDERQKYFTPRLRPRRRNKPL